MLDHSRTDRAIVLLTAAFAASLFSLRAAAQSASATKPATPGQSAPSTQLAASSQAPAPGRKASAAAGPVRTLPGLPRRAQMYYQGVWGVDSLRVKAAESGEMVRFSWRVLDPAKAALLHDKKLEPQLIDPQAGVKLVIPQLENVGTLRQTSTPIAGNVYWMAFSNSGRRVKPGDRVIVAIGHFHAMNLMVE